MAAEVPNDSQWEPSWLKIRPMAEQAAALRGKQGPFSIATSSSPAPGYVSTHMGCSDRGLPRWWPSLGLRK